jgi:lipopolysaccharide biosynthesis regulator YciM
MLVKLAERELQRKQTAIARKISEDVVRKNPQNVEAKMVKGYAEIKDGDLKAAEKTFDDLSRSKGQGQVLGEEGMVTVYAMQGQSQKALKLAEKVERKAPDRGHVNTARPLKKSPVHRFKKRSHSTSSVDCRPAWETTTRPVSCMIRPSQSIRITLKRPPIRPRPMKKRANGTRLWIPTRRRSRLIKMMSMP